MSGNLLYNASGNGIAAALAAMNGSMDTSGGAILGLGGTDPSQILGGFSGEQGMNSIAAAMQQRNELMKNMAPGKFTTGVQNFGTIAQGLAGLGSMYLGYQQLKQQKEAFKFNKGVVNTNLNNGILDYNRRLTDTLTNRSLNNGQGQGYISSEMSKWQAKRS